VPGADEQIRSLHRTVKARTDKREHKERIAQNLTGMAPKTGAEAFERWFWTLDAEMQAKVRVWLLGPGPSEFLKELERAEQEKRAAAMTLH
jgi:hypothetical protein